MPGTQAFLERLGGRVRALREEAGITVTDLARRSGLSRRFVTETEAGRANPSVASLVRLAEALGESPAGLLPGTLERRSERVALLGLRGAGKSTVGAALALALEVPFVELDRRVEERAGLELGELFDLHGPEGFRRHEAEALEQVLSEGDRMVIATGGSLVTHARTFERLRATCRTVWLQAEPEEHFARVVLAQGDRRPIEARPRAMEELRAILAAREPLYASCELTLSTSGKSPEAVVAGLVERL
jgi:XRE family aerobic/anaerobic benzoate catabolism transcriptional regulator